MISSLDHFISIIERLSGLDALLFNDEKVPAIYSWSRLYSAHYGDLFATRLWVLFGDVIYCSTAIV